MRGDSIPKVKITKDMIIKAAFSLLQEKGEGALNARGIATQAECSVQPIYSCYSNMEELLEDLYEYCRLHYLSFVERYANKGHYFFEAGKNHIAFARSEAELFKFIFMSSHTKVGSFQELLEQFGKKDVIEYIKSTTGLSEIKAMELYTDMMVFTHGIAVMLATKSAILSDAEIYQKVDAACQAFFEHIQKG
jgi:AcrR family transcriptional regulator